MLTTNITLAEKYDYLSDKFKKAFTFLRETDLASLPIGRTEIDGDEVYASVQSYTTMTVEECAFEYEPVKNLTPSMDYDAERDLIFYNEPDDAGSVILKAGDFAIVPPEDGHAPRRMTKNGPCPVKKIVVKVKL